MGITREHISQEDGWTHHRILIRDFEGKMTFWRPGRFVKLRTLHVDGLPLRLQIYPNGFTEDDRGHVSYFVENLGDVDVMIDFELRLRDRTINEEEFQIQAHFQ